MNFKSIVISTVVSVAAFAGNTAVPAPAPVMPTVSRASIAEPKLNCPTGTRQGGGQNSKQEASFCMRLDAAGRPVIEGPYVALHLNGKKAVEGQYVDGKRTGLWTSFDEAGLKIEEVTFANDLYQGARVQWANGKKIIEENYVAGRRQGEQKSFDAAGKVTVVQYMDDRPVAK